MVLQVAAGHNVPAMGLGLLLLGLGWSAGWVAGSVQLLVVLTAAVSLAWSYQRGRVTVVR